MKVAWQSLEMICRRRLALTLLLFFTLHTSTSATDYHSVYIPVGVGKAQDFKALTQFGMFNEKYQVCGKNTANELNEEHKGSMEVSVICEPHPERVIVADKKVDYGKHVRDFKKECELMTCSGNDYPPEGQAMGKIDNGAAAGDQALAPKPENSATNVCADKRTQYSAGATGAVLFANEGQCFDTYPALVRTLDSKNFKQVPRWLDASVKQYFTKRPFYFDGEQLRQSWQARVNYNFEQITDNKGLAYKDCLTACDSGKVVKLTMKPGIAYPLMIYLSGKCPAFRICLDPKFFDDDNKVPICEDKKMINVLVDNGVVLWPNDHRSSLIELKSQKHSENQPVAIEFGYDMDFYVMNQYRERVQTDVTSDGRKKGGYGPKLAERLAFFFPTEECLQETAGLWSKLISVGKALTSKKVVKGNPYSDKGTPVVITEETKIKEEEPPEVIHNIALSTTPAPMIVAPGAVSLADADQLETNIGSSAAYVSGKWWTWGIYIGFVIGTLLTLGIGAGIFYLLRRTVFGVWYRGMYKRYGCDVSGTTGGITGVGFGNTVTGDMTVKGTTGGTTAGTTGGTTGTTGTSSTMSKTGTSTLAM